MSKSFTMGKVDAARHEKNLWKRRANSAEIALRRIGAVIDQLAQEDADRLKEIEVIHQDWKQASQEQSSTPIKSMKIKAYIYPLTEEERTKAIDALENWNEGDGTIEDGVDAVLEAVASLRDPTTSRGPGL